MARLNQSLEIVFFAILTIAIQTAHAELNVVSDYGGKSMRDFYDMLDPQDEYGEAQQQHLIPKNMKIDEGMYLPVHSKQLIPARFESYKVDFPTLQPFILIGYDDLSIEWLKARGDDLSVMSGLVGVVVNIDDIKQLNILKSLTTIPLYPMPGDELAEKFRLKHYPALITSQTVEQ